MTETPALVEHVTTVLQEHEAKLQVHLAGWMQQNESDMMRMFSMLDQCVRTLDALNIATMGPLHRFEAGGFAEAPRRSFDIGSNNPGEGEGLKFAAIEESPAKLNQNAVARIKRPSSLEDEADVGDLPLRSSIVSDQKTPAVRENDGRSSSSSTNRKIEKLASATSIGNPSFNFNEQMKQTALGINDQMKQTALGKQILKVAHGRQRKSTNVINVMSHSFSIAGGARWLQRVDYVVAFLILANAFFLGWQTEAMARDRPLPEILAHVIATFFAVAFGLELLLKVVLQGSEFFNGPDRFLNLFDVVVVVSAFLEVLGFDNLPQISILRILRLFRLLKIIRAVRVLNFFREFRLIILSCASACRAVFWVLCLFLLMLFTAALGVTDACLDHCHKHNDEDLACKYFGSLGASMLSLFQAVCGGLLWGEAMEALSPVSLAASLIFLIFVSVCVIMVLNINLALILDVVHRVISQDREGAINDEIMFKEQYIRLMRSIFHEIDLNSSGAISLDELQIAVGDSRMDALLAALKIDAHDMERLFSLLDTDNTNSVDIEEFLLGCQRLKGEARAIDVVSIQRELGTVLHYVLELKNKLFPEQVEDLNYEQDSETQELEETMVLSSQLSKSSSRLTGNVHKKHHRPLIKKAEERAMLLSELIDVCEVINRNCPSEKWTNPRTGQPLQPENVDLYQLVYYYICPQTVPDGIRLRGLQRGEYAAGDYVAQFENYSRAEGVVMEDSDGGSVRIKVTRGRFISNEQGRSFETHVNNLNRGVPEKVIPTVALSYKELVSPKPLKPRWYCSHWWGERVFQFVSCCKEHALRRKMEREKASYWVCGYANRQYDLVEDVIGDIKSTAFFKAIGVAQGVLLVLDENASPFSRIWCDFEIYQALQTESKKMLDIVTVTPHSEDENSKPHLLSDTPLSNESAREKTHRESHFPLNILAKGMQAKLEDGKASVDLDRTNILSHITKGSQDPEALHHANCALNSFFARAAWPQAVKKRLVRDFDASQPGQIKLPQLMAQDVELKSFIMSWEHMDEVNDVELNTLAEGFPPNLRELSLSFEGCVNITSLGVQALAAYLPKGLQVLKLDFLGCRQIQDEGLEVLAESLPPTLQSISLHFDKCQRISARGIQALAENVPKNARFQGTFKGTVVDKNFGSLGELKRQAGRKNTSTR